MEADVGLPMMLRRRFFVPLLLTSLAIGVTFEILIWRCPHGLFYLPITQLFCVADVLVFRCSGWEQPALLEEALSLGATHYIIVSPHALRAQ